LGGAVLEIEALPAEAASIDGPRTWAEHREGGGDHCEQDVNPLAIPRRSVERECDPQFVGGNQSGYHRRPHSGEQEDASRGGEQITSESEEVRRMLGEVHHAERDQSATSAQPEEQEA
jgi:hypothetical protein